MILNASVKFLQQLEMIENFNRSESQQEALEIDNTYLLKVTKDKCQYCGYEHEKKKDKCSAFGKMHRKYAKRTTPKLYAESKRKMLKVSLRSK